MSMYVSNIVWHDATQTRPAEDGTYLVATGHYDKTIGTMLYTAEGGWNTYRISGTLHDERAMKNESGYIRLWTDMPTPEEVIAVE